MIKKNILWITGLLTVFSISNSFALENARPLASDSRIKVVAFEENNVVPVYGTTFISTQIIFGQNEKIIDVQGGDADAWTINVNKAISNVLNIKPTVLNSNTDIITSTVDDTGKIRRYFLHLMSNKNPNQVEAGNETYAIQFIYPEEERAKLLAQLDEDALQQKTIVNASKNPKDYNWSYSFNGSRSIMPLHVFDDGKFTYLQLQPNQDVPAIFAVNNTAGKESVVNYRRVGNTLVVQQISPQFTLRDGRFSVASIFNNKLVTKMKNE